MNRRIIELERRDGDVYTSRVLVVEHGPVTFTTAGNPYTFGRVVDEVIGPQLPLREPWREPRLLSRLALLNSAAVI